MGLHRAPRVAVRRWRGARQPRGAAEGWAALVAATSTLDYLVARGLEASDHPRARKSLLALSLVANLGLLAAFKYADFFLRSAEDALRAVLRARTLAEARRIAAAALGGEAT